MASDQEFAASLSPLYMVCKSNDFNEYMPDTLGN